MVELIRSTNVEDTNVFNSFEKKECINKFDLKKITSKIHSIKRLFEEFENERLPYLKQKLSEEDYKRLEEEFKKLKKMFYKEMDFLKDYVIVLEKSKGDKKKLYEELINHLINKFYWILKVSSTDNTRKTLWWICVYYIWLSPNKFKQNYGLQSWEELVNWIEKYEDVNPKKLKDGDLILIPWQITLLKNLKKYEKDIDLKELFLNNKVIFKKGVDTNRKAEIYLLLLNFFQYRGKYELVRSILKDFNKLLKNQRYKPKIYFSTIQFSQEQWKEELNINKLDKSSLDYYYSKSKEFLNNKNLLKKTLKLFEANPNWKWYEFPEEVFKWIVYGILKSISSYVDLIDWKTINNLVLWIKELIQNPIQFVEKFLSELKSEFWVIDFSAPHWIWEAIWTIIVDLSLWAAWGKLISGMAKVLIKNWSKISKFGEIGWVMESIWQKMKALGDYWEEVCWWYNVEKLKNSTKKIFSFHHPKKLVENIKSDMKLLFNKDYPDLWDEYYAIVKAMRVTDTGELILNWIDFSKRLPKILEKNNIPINNINKLLIKVGILQNWKIILDKWKFFWYLTRKIRNSEKWKTDIETEIAQLLWIVYKNIFYPVL